MELLRSFILILLLAASAFAQSGRRNLPPPKPTPTPTPETKRSPTPSLTSQVTAEKDQDYRCTDDATLAHLLDKAEVTAYTVKEVDVKAEITARPDPGYTREARRAAVQGYVVLKLLLLGDGKLDRVTVVRRLPYGLTENAIRAACKIKFNPALKGGQPVAQWVTIQYEFRLADSSIFGP